MLHFFQKSSKQLFLSFVSLDYAVSLRNFSMQYAIPTFQLLCNFLDYFLRYSLKFRLINFHKMLSCHFFFLRLMLWYFWMRFSPSSQHISLDPGLNSLISTSKGNIQAHTNHFSFPLLSIKMSIMYWVLRQKEEKEEVAAFYIFCPAYFYVE